jgi:hypothetical protein
MQHTAIPSSQPSCYPSHPSSQPSISPSSLPTQLPSNPSTQPSFMPSNQPMSRPTAQPYDRPSSKPSAQPILKPSRQPSSMPTIYGKACPLSTYYYPPENKCKQCQQNSNSYERGSMTCICNAGYKQTGSDITLFCRACPAGYTSKRGASECTKCSPGYFSPVPGSGICTICVAGTISGIKVGATDCTACPAGEYSSVEGASVCQRVPPGYYTSLPGSTSFHICDQGTYSENFWSTLNAPECASGTITANFGSKSGGDCVSPRVNFIAVCLLTVLV